jgi:hypothetical protein
MSLGRCDGVLSGKNEGFMLTKAVGLTVPVKIGNDVGNMDGESDGSDRGKDVSGGAVSGVRLGRI